MYLRVRRLGKANNYRTIVRYNSNLHDQHGVRNRREEVGNVRARGKWRRNAWYWVDTSASLARKHRSGRRARVLAIIPEECEPPSQKHCHKSTTTSFFRPLANCSAAFGLASSSRIEATALQRGRVRYRLHYVIMLKNVILQKTSLIYVPERMLASLHRCCTYRS